MTVQDEYVLIPSKQLIEINEDVRNFKASIRIQAKSSDGSFEGGIVDQESLDNGDFDLQESNQGLLEINIHMDQNQLQTFYLVLRAETETPVLVEIQFQPLPDYIPPEGPSKENETTTSMFHYVRQYGVEVIVVLLLLLSAILFLRKGNSSGGSTPVAPQGNSLLQRLRNGN